MEYPKEVMRQQELLKMGFDECFLCRAFNTPGQDFAWKNDPFKKNSPILFDTKGFEKWRLKQVRLSQASR